MTKSDLATPVYGPRPKVLYLIGSLRNRRVPELAKRLRRDFAAAGQDVEVFDDWYAAGPEADDFWKEYEQNRGRTYNEALEGHAARNVFAFDKRNLDRSSHVLLILPAGKSGHMEVMYGAYGVGANAAILLDPDDVRWDVMYQFIPTILSKDEEVFSWVLGEGEPNAATQTTSDEQWNWDSCGVEVRDKLGQAILEALSTRGRLD